MVLHVANILFKVSITSEFGDDNGANGPVVPFTFQSFKPEPFCGGGMAKWLGHRTCNPDIAGSSPTLITWICFTVAPFSNPRPRFVNSPLVCLPPVGILNKCYVQFVYLFH